MTLLLPSKLPNPTILKKINIIIFGRFMGSIEFQGETNKVTMHPAINTMPRAKITFWSVFTCPAY